VGRCADSQNLAAKTATWAYGDCYTTEDAIGGVVRRLGASTEQELSEYPEFLNALKHALLRGLVDLDPWVLLTSDEQVNARSEGVNGRYPGRVVLCFAERQDTDDVACLVLGSGTGFVAGQILTVHDYAEPGTEVDAVFPDFWEWFKSAVDDMVDTFRHLTDRR
jgi:hypothetical protein